MSIFKFIYTSALFFASVDAGKIVVQNLMDSRQNVTVDVDADTTMLQIKEMIREQKGIPVARLVYYETLLDDATTVAELDAQPGKSIKKINMVVARIG